MNKENYKIAFERNPQLEAVFAKIYAERNLSYSETWHNFCDFMKPPIINMIENGNKMEELKSTGYNLFLDDMRVPEKVTWVILPSVEWKIVRNYADFCWFIEKYGLPNVVTFDHDLSLEDADTFVSSGRKVVDYNQYREKTGLHCAKFLIDYCVKNGKPLPEWYVHSKNPVGKERIEQELEAYNMYEKAEA